MSIRSLTILGAGAGAVLILTVLAVSLFTLRLIRDGLSAGPGAAPASPGQVAVMALALAACLYLAVGAVAREAFSSRRFAVRFSPNRDLYRAADVQMRHVFLSEAAPRAVLLLGLSAAVCAAALIVLHEAVGPALPWSGVLWILPFAVAGSWLALSSRQAAADPPVHTPGRSLALGTLACVAVAIPGLVLGRILPELLAAKAAPDLAHATASGAEHWALPAASAATAVFAALTAHSLRTVGRHSFPVTRRVSTATAPAASGASRTVPLFWRFLATNIVKDRSFALFRGMGLCLLLVASGVLGLRLGGMGPDFFTSGPGIPGAAALIVFMVSLVGSELVSKANNPVGLLPRLRYAWESGLHPGTLAWAVIATQSLPLALLAAPALALIVWALTGTVPLALFLIPWTIAAAGIIGNAVSRVTAKQADGSMETSIAAAFISVVLAVPVLGLCLVGDMYPTIAAALYAAVLTGGAHRCLQHRILSRR
ncbi:hypothetical protein [Pseudarthrobacter cellobiosi]|uniref:hypothetical protein n=1 Tax=Pseudarthrobacter cellobiosi TaxID=2953654 RepID=UPI00208F0922|nr:hypothetical protein [Pseudarthrobacter sp. HLT1-5]MCO4254635.1 hypothetical protein [Pseudarthrobacter sp. HLT1-5]